MMSKAKEQIKYNMYVKEQLPVYNKFMLEDNAVRRYYSGDGIPSDPEHHPKYVTRFPVFDNYTYLDSKVIGVSDPCFQGVDGNRKSRSIHDVACEKEFVESFHNHNCTREIFELKIIKDNFCIAGGSVLSHIICTSNKSDVDLFPVGCTEAVVKKAISDLYHFISKTSEVEVHYTKYAVTLKYKTPTRPVTIQFILLNSRTLAEVLCSFDINCCAFAIFNDAVYGTNLSVHAVTSFTNVVDPSKQSLSYIERLHKYRLRGFSIIIPGFDDDTEIANDDADLDAEIDDADDDAEIANDTEIANLANTGIANLANTGIAGIVNFYNVYGSVPHFVERKVNAGYGTNCATPTCKYGPSCVITRGASKLFKMFLKQDHILYTKYQSVNYDDDGAVETEFYNYDKQSDNIVWL